MSNTALRARRRATSPAAASDEELATMFESVANYFRLLAEPTRLKVLHVLCQGEHSVGEVVQRSGLTQTNVSRQLNQLFAAGTLSRRKDGNTVYYSVHDQALIDICRAACVRIAGQIEQQQPLREAFLDFYSI